MLCTNAPAAAGVQIGPDVGYASTSVEDVRTDVCTATIAATAATDAAPTAANVAPFAPAAVVKPAAAAAPAVKAR